MNRRVFLHSLTGTLLSMSCTSSPDTPSATPETGSRRLSPDQLCFITDEYSQDLEEALAFAKEFGIRKVEIRGFDGKYGFLHETSKLREARELLAGEGVRVALLDTPILKCLAPGFEVDPEVEEDIAMAEASFPIPRNEQFPRAAEFLDKAIEAAKILETDKIRVFSFWRFSDPAQATPLLLEKLGELAGTAEKHGMKLCIENENACNLATCAETMVVLKQAPSNVGIIWDVQNGAVMGEKAYSDGYNLLDKSRVWHVHLKDFQRDPVTGAPNTVAVGDGILPYPRIFRALAGDGYKNAISMETHFRHDGSKKEASRRSMKGILEALEA